MSTFTPRNLSQLAAKKKREKSYEIIRSRTIVHYADGRCCANAVPKEGESEQKSWLDEVWTKRDKAYKQAQKSEELRKKAQRAKKG